MFLRSLARTGLATLVGLALALPVAAQLDLPGKPRGTPAGPGGELQPVAPPSGDVAPRENAAPLDLPAAPAPAPAPAPVVAALPGSAARALFGELGRTHDLHLVD